MVSVVVFGVGVVAVVVAALIAFIRRLAVPVGCSRGGGGGDGGGGGGCGSPTATASTECAGEASNDVAEHAPHGGGGDCGGGGGGGVGDGGDGCGDDDDSGVAL